MFSETSTNNEWSFQTERAVLKWVYFVQNMKSLCKYHPFLDTFLIFSKIIKGKLFSKCHKDKCGAQPYGSYGVAISPASQFFLIYTALVIEINRIIYIQNHIINCLFISTLAHSIFCSYAMNDKLDLFFFQISVQNN